MNFLQGAKLLFADKVSCAMPLKTHLDVSGRARAATFSTAYKLLHILACGYAGPPRRPTTIPAMPMMSRMIPITIPAIARVG